MTNTRAKRIGGRRKPADLLEEKVATVITVVRRLGYVLGKAHEACEADLIAAGFIQTATVLRDDLKPLVDALLHFSADAQTEMFPEEDEDGTP